MDSDAQLTCSLCGTIWLDYQAFFSDSDLVVNGYQASLGDADQGLILVTHDVPHCGTTLAVIARDLRPLYRGPVWPEVQAGTDPCPRHCLDDGDLESCTVRCSMAWVREVLQWLRRHELPSHADQEKPQ
jgi:hypothetical protein